jgi:hypothetical protein
MLARNGYVGSGTALARARARRCRVAAISANPLNVTPIDDICRRRRVLPSQRRPEPGPLRRGPKADEASLVMLPVPALPRTDGSMGRAPCNLSVYSTPQRSESWAAGKEVLVCDDTDSAVPVLARMATRRGTGRQALRYVISRSSRYG